MRACTFAPGVDLAWADDYAEVSGQRDETLEQLGLLRRALADRCGHYWRLVHEVRRRRDQAPTPGERLHYRLCAVQYEYVLRELLAVRRAGRGTGD